MGQTLLVRARANWSPYDSGGPSCDQDENLLEKAKRLSREEYQRICPSLKIQAWAGFTFPCMIDKSTTARIEKHDLKKITALYLEVAEKEECYEEEMDLKMAICDSLSKANQGLDIKFKTKIPLGWLPMAYIYKNLF